MMLEAKIYVGNYGDKIMIEYTTRLDGVQVNTLEAREIMSSSKETNFRNKLVEEMYSQINKLESMRKDKRPKKKSWLKFIF